MKINYSNEEIIKGEKSIFLAGPEGDNAWKVVACNRLEELGFDGVIYISKDLNKTDAISQAKWEKEALNESMVVLLWIPKNLNDISDITEKIYLFNTNKIMYGRNKNKGETRFLDWIYKFDYREEPYDNLDELLVGTVDKVNTLTAKREKIKRITK